MKNTRIIETRHMQVSYNCEKNGCQMTTQYTPVTIRIDAPDPGIGDFWPLGQNEYELESVPEEYRDELLQNGVVEYNDCEVTF